ncbi:MAG: FtsX-like permease family protein [Lachnospiraceae bacterium]|nr:FtsX-like permease family protein [Lachnospiraceae bacterium]
MQNKPLHSRRIALLNIRHSLTRTVGLVLLVAALSFVFFGGAILVGGLRNGLQNMKARLGADIMIVPVENNTDMEAILLKGEPSCFYFKKTLEDKVRNLEGVKLCTSQFFLTSLDAECCDTRVQLIGFEPETDFSVQPWIARVYDKELLDGAVIIGSDIHTKEGEKLKLFDMEYEIAARLDATGTGLDQAVYANFATIRQMYAAAYEKGQRFLEEADPDNSISAILVRAEDGYDRKELIRSIRKELGGVQVVESQNMISKTAENMEQIATFLYLLAGMFVGLAVVTLCLVFTLTANGRKKEFAILRSLGATRKTLSGILLWESVLIGIAGGALGALSAAIVVFPFHVYIGDRLGMPYLLPGVGAILTVLVLDMGVSALIAPLSACVAAVRISHAETYLTFEEGS